MSREEQPGRQTASPEAALVAIGLSVVQWVI
jgi:hypothetical protein